MRRDDTAIAASTLQPGVVDTFAVGLRSAERMIWVATAKIQIYGAGHEPLGDLSWDGNINLRALVDGLSPS
jgi:hypothetical protein